jgi:hypothetical protein
MSGAFCESLNGNECGRIVKSSSIGKGVSKWA